MAFKPDPKPQKRIKDRKAMALVRQREHECRICGNRTNLSLHHLIKRSQGGDDVASNLYMVCGDGTRGCHGLVESRNKSALSTLRKSLRDGEIFYLIDKKGQDWLDRIYPG